jgi:PII-like signaling protein/nucleotide-binding universal stress UspA family protein
MLAHEDKFQRVLIGLEDSHASRTAFDYALQLARHARAELHVLCVGSIPGISSATIDEVKHAQQQARTALRGLLEAARETAEAHGQPIVTEVRFGHTAEAILAYAAEYRVDLIVMGKRRHHVGSVAEKVAREAPCPVLLASTTEVVHYRGPRGHRRSEWEIRKDTREKLEGRAKMLRVYVDEKDLWQGVPLYEAIVRKLRLLDVAGATVFRGILGYGAGHRIRRGHLLGLVHDLPVLISAVDTEEKVRGVLPVLNGMVREGLVVLSDVNVIKYTHTHHELEVHPIPRRRSTD